jgi:Protein kinase domain/RDD family
MTGELDETLPGSGELAADVATAATAVGRASDKTATSDRLGPVDHSTGAVAIGPGIRLAHFEIVKPLGHGGMGEVYLARDIALDRPVALKLLPAAVARDAGRRERLVREARAQARLNHPNVAHLYYIGEDHGHLFFAMEYVDGETLGQRLERGPLSTDDALELARMAALGLREAHRHGFTHRDIKPSNLMIDRHGVLKVMDFGLVTDAVATSDAGASAGHQPIAASALVGTPLYMAPEQGRGLVVDHRADIYALGATLHHMIAGAPPFSGNSAAELLSLHDSGARSSLVGVRGRRRTVGLIDAVVTAMMSKRAADRPGSYDDVIAAMDRASPTRSRPAGFWPRSVAALVDLLLGAIISIPLASALSGSGNLGLAAFVLVAMPFIVARFATTVGHALFDLAIVPAVGDGRLGFFRTALRSIVMTGPMFVGTALDDLGEALDSTLVRHIGVAVTIVGIAYPAIELARVALTTADARTLWDRVAGTRVRYKARPSEAALPAPTTTTGR